MVAMLGGAIFALVSMLRVAGLIQPIELAAYDLLVRTFSPKNPNQSPVVVIQFTEEDIANVGHWPLSDKRLASFLEKLADYNPRAIGVDLYRDNPVMDGGEDFERVLEENQNIFLIEKFGEDAFSRIHAPEILRGTHRVGFADLAMDPGGVVRRGLLFLDNGQEIFYSFPLVLSLAYLKAENIVPTPSPENPMYLQLGKSTIAPFETNMGGYVNADANGYQFMLDFEGGASPFQRYTMQDIETGNVDKKRLHDSIVLIGAVAESVKDYFETPFSRTGKLEPAMPGIVLHAHSVSQLLRMAMQGKQQLSTWQESYEYSWIAFWAFAGAVVTLMTGVAWRLLIFSVLGVGIIALTSVTMFSGGVWVPASPVLFSWLFSIVAVVFYLSALERTQRRELMELFSRNVSSEVAKEIWRRKEEFSSGGRLASVETVATILFTDLKNFTLVSEMLGPSKLMRWLNQYMEKMAGLVIKYNGIIDDYYGDAIKANFGVPLASSDEKQIAMNAKQAASCALAMRDTIADLNKEWERENLPPVCMRVGICTGDVVAGFLGSSRRMKYTTVGDTVNTAARLESYDKEVSCMADNEQGCRILVSESTWELLHEDFEMDEVGQVNLKGKSEAVRIFRLNGYSSEHTNV
jgi:adenylate cyclase